MCSKIILKLFVVIGLTALLNFSCTSSLNSFTSPNNILGKLGNQPELSSFVSLLEKVPAIGKLLGGKNPVTVLAPNNEAIVSLGQETINHLTSSKEGLKELGNIIKQHIIPGIINAEEIIGGNVESVAGKRVQIGDAKIVGTPIIADNGVIQIINKVLK
jgi:uncharacterized surface protein with fasciclin (FAS1) repeats